MNRRQVIQLGLSATASTLLLDQISFAGDKTYGGFNLGLQSYSLRTIPQLEKQIDLIRDLGLHYVEIYNVPSNTPKERLDQIKQLFKERDIKVMAFGVVRLTNNETQTREHFEFAKSMGVYSISADPDPDSFDLLDKLVAEYKMNVAIHPHGPRHRYPGWKSVQKAIEGHHKRIGICMDTGHVTRAGDDVIEGINTLKKRVYGVHLKDPDAKGEDQPIGSGRLDIPGIFKALKQAKFKGIVSLEDEVRSPDVLVTIRQSLDYLRRMFATAELSRK